MINALLIECLNFRLIDYVVSNHSQDCEKKKSLAVIVVDMRLISELKETLEVINFKHWLLVSRIVFSWVDHLLHKGLDRVHVIDVALSFLCHIGDN